MHFTQIWLLTCLHSIYGKYNDVLYHAKHHASYAAEESGQALINPMNHEKKSQAECLSTQRKGRCGDDTWQRLGHAKLPRLRLFLHLLKLGYKEIEVSPLDNNHTAKKRSSRSS